MASTHRCVRIPVHYSLIHYFFSTRFSNLILNKRKHSVRFKAVLSLRNESNFTILYDTYKSSQTTAKCKLNCMTYYSNEIFIIYVILYFYTYLFINFIF